MRQVSTVLLTIIVGMFIVLYNTTEAKAQHSKKIILAGYKHQPPVPTSGSGIATVELHGDTLTIKGKFEDLTGNYSGAYLMVSIRGRAGNQLYRLKTELNEDKTGGSLVGTQNKFVLSEAEKKLLKDGELYINISSFEHPKGELRGNIGPMGK